MEVPLQITYRDVDKTEAIESLIHEKVAKLEKVCDYITSCRIAIERAQNRRQTGNPYRVRIDIRIPPRHELVIDRTSTEEEEEEPLPALIRDAFEIARRRLDELVAAQSGEVKRHPEEEENMAFVVKLFRDQGYGFLRTTDGRRIYFHANSVLHDEFDRLEIGTGVRFVEEMGTDGPQATTVEITNKPGVRASEAKDPWVEKIY